MTSSHSTRNGKEPNGGGSDTGLFGNAGAGVSNLTLSKPAVQNLTMTSNAYGGIGGATLSGTGATGAAATATVSGGAQSTVLISNARGGNGGAAATGTGGTGGTSVATEYDNAGLNTDSGASVFGGAGGAVTTSGTGGKGGDATATALSESRGTVNLGAGATSGTGGSSVLGNGGNAGNATATATALLATAGTTINVDAFSYAAGQGAGSGFGKGTEGNVVAIGNGASTGGTVSVSTLAGGNQLAASGTATSTALSLGGGNVKAYAEVAYAAQAKASADATAAGSGVATSSIYVFGSPTGTAHTASHSSGGLSQHVDTTTDIGVGSTGVAAATSTSTSTFNGGLSLPSFQATNTAPQAFSYASGTPDSTVVSQQLAAHSNVAAAVSAANLSTQDLGSIGAQTAPGASTSLTYSASAEFRETLAAPGSVVLGLLDFTGRDSGQAVALDFKVSNLGHQLLDMSFTSLSAADTWFTDHALSLGTLSGNVDLLMSFSLTGQLDQGADFSYLVATGALANNPAAFIGATPVPEPDEAALMLLGSSVLAALRWAARRRQPRQRRHA